MLFVDCQHATLFLAGYMFDQKNENKNQKLDSGVELRNDMHGIDIPGFSHAGADSIRRYDNMTLFDIVVSINQYD